ncbi:MAG TPA: prolyl oligopeptidase family serine peptidase [Chloroflexota bacterium]|nr:prolyl oligopeptidase family serine peptidase [Chloroflexota bacterium]
MGDGTVHVFGDPVPAPTQAQLLADRMMPYLRQGMSNGLTAVAKLRGGRSLDLEPVARMLGLRWFARRFYGALIDANGASYADVEETMSRIRSFKPDAWMREWRRTAERFDHAGREGAIKGRSTTAVELLVKASSYYRFAEMALLEDSDERHKLHQASIDAYVLAGKFMDPPVERVCLRVNGLESPAYFRVPRQVDRPPVVLVIPGLGMVKEHGDFPDGVLIARGMAAMTIDLPGQGENRQHFAMDQTNALSIVTAAIDYLAGRADVDGERMGLIGTSMGAAAALLAAAHDRRIKALVEIAGFYYPTAWWDRFPYDIKEFLRYVMGAKDQQELLDLIRPVNLQGHVREIRCPLLVVHGQQDVIVPFEESDLIWAEATAPKERFIFASGDHGCVNVGEARPLIGDWIAEKLGV